MKLTAIIPAFNEELNIGRVIGGVKKYTQDIIVVDDGSQDKTSKIALQNGARVCRHVINRGLGGAIGTGVKAAILSGADIILTIDADGQHDPAQIPALIEPLLKGDADIVIGSRFLEKQPMPVFRKFGNIFFNFITFLLFGVKSTDTQSGFRAFNSRVAKEIEIFTNGMEVSSEIVQEIGGRKFRLKEVPIKAIYTSYSLSKGQNFFLGIKTILKLLILKLTK